MRKTLFIAVGWVLLIQPSFAQSFNDYIELTREVLKTEKKAAVAQAMQLNDAESGPFWDLYNEYNAELYKVHTDRVNLIKEFAASYENLSDEKADELWSGSMDYQNRLLKLKKRYYKKFRKILSAVKASRYFQIENKIDALVSAELALEIPLIETK